MDRYKLELLRKASESKSIYQPVRSFYFEAESQQTAIYLARAMNVFPGADDCDMASLFAPDGNALWADYRNA